MGLFALGVTRSPRRSPGSRLRVDWRLRGLRGATRVGGPRRRRHFGFLGAPRAAIVAAFFAPRRRPRPSGRLRPLPVGRAPGPPRSSLALPWTRSSPTTCRQGCISVRPPPSTNPARSQAVDRALAPRRAEACITCPRHADPRVDERPPQRHRAHAVLWSRPSPWIKPECCGDLCGDQLSCSSVAEAEGVLHDGAVVALETAIRRRLGDSGRRPARRDAQPFVGQYSPISSHEEHTMRAPSDRIPSPPGFFRPQRCPPLEHSGTGSVGTRSPLAALRGTARGRGWG